MTSSALTPTLISSVAELEAFLSTIPPSSTLYLDLEGNSLSRHGTISLITILIHPQKVVRLIDVLVLGKSAFTTASNSGKTLKSIFEDPDIPKCLWDVRNDADALWALYHVSLAGVTDIQLLENASRTGDKTYVRGLDKSVQFDLKLGFMELNRWIRTKKEVVSLMAANVFASRPMDAKTVQYCANDVLHLPDLHALYLKRIQGDWLARAKQESERRVAEAHSPGYEPQSPSKKLGPWGSGTERRVVTLDEMLDEWEQQREDDLARDIFGDDDEVGYYDYDDYDDKPNSGDAVCPEAFDSCWDRNS
jgi:exonuclease 3'-5' domain-containing protein 1